jgi:hypothetical protein
VTATDAAINTVSEIEKPSDFFEDQAAIPLTGEDFADWRDSASSCCLLVTAPAGSGKSVLSNFVTTHLEHRAATNRTEKIIYYFCNIRIPISERSAEAVVRALIVQLCQDQSDLIAMLSPRFEKDSEAFQKAPLSELWGILSLVIQKHPYSHVYCIIDGLDVYGQCMVELVQKLLSLFGSSESRAPRWRKLLCTSRPDPSIMEAWEGHLVRQLRTHESDLRVYIESRTSNSRNFSDSMRRAARSALLEDFEGPHQSYQAGPTFLWISMAIRKLEQIKFLSVDKIRKEIEASSRDLHELFKSIIVATSERARENAVILAWIIYGHSLLSVDQLRDAVAIDPSHEYTSYDQLDDARPLITRSSIHRQLGVIVDIVDDHLFLIHQSLEDFIRETNILDRWILPEPRLFLADYCMRYEFIYWNDIQARVSCAYCNDRYTI